MLCIAQMYLLTALEPGFGIKNLLVVCRSGETWVMPDGQFDGARPQYVHANGFRWYDTGQERK